MNSCTELTRTDVSFTDKEQSWKEHSRQQKGSGLSRVAYCRKHQLNYRQFGYWEDKWRHQTPPTVLLPVHLKRQPKVTSALEPEILCTLMFKNGHKLEIHDKSVLSSLLSFWG